MRRIMDSSAIWGWRLPLLDAAAFDVRSDREKARDYLASVAAERIEEYLNVADESAVRDIFQKAGMIRARDRTPQEKTAACLARAAQIIFFGCWGIFALHLLGMI